MPNGKRQWVCNGCGRFGVAASMQSRVKIRHDYATGRPRYFGAGFCRNKQACANRKAAKDRTVSQAEQARRLALHHARKERQRLKAA
jgi:hypothetical protein